MGINVDELMEGMVLEKNIIRRDGALIVNKGTTLTPRIIERLRKLSGHINFEGNETTDMDEVKETVEESLRKDTENCLNDFFNNPTEAQVQKIKDNADEIVEKTTQSNDPQYDLNAYAEQENGPGSHAVRVACFSILLSQIYNYTVQDKDNSALVNLNYISKAALLQDL